MSLQVAAGGSTSFDSSADVSGDWRLASPDVPMILQKAAGTSGIG
jgi:hypothetical protein